MRILISLLPLLAVAGCEATGRETPAPEATAVAASGAALLPDRLLDCTLGHARGVDPSRMQRNDEVRYEGAFPLTLRLPSIPARTGPPPDPTEQPEPVHPETRVIADPKGIMKDVPTGFWRVVDMWPERVELAQVIAAPVTSLMIVTDIDASAGRATLFVARVADAASFDTDSIYQGSCTVRSTPPGALTTAAR